MKILITGASGFVGTNLSKKFIKKSYQYESLNLRNSNWKSEIDTEATAILHLAGKAHDLKNSSNP